MRFEVPQFIEVEDKIVGPLTWKQFAYVAGGAGAALIAFVILPFFLFVLVGVPIIALAGFLAFHRVNSRPFSLFLESFVQYFTNNKLYLWKRRQSQVVHGEASKSAEPQRSTQPVGPVEPAGNKKLSSLSRKLTLDTLEDEERPVPVPESKETD